MDDSRKRELKGYFKDVQRFTKSHSTQHKNVQNLKKLGGGKVNLPYKMLQGMRAKSVDRHKQQVDMDKKLGILADTSRGDKKVMQGYFEQKSFEQKEEKRLNKGTERGLNLHLFSGAKFRDGALNLTKSGIA